MRNFCKVLIFLLAPIWGSCMILFIVLAACVEESWGIIHEISTGLWDGIEKPLNWIGWKR